MIELRNLMLVQIILRNVISRNDDLFKMISILKPCKDKELKAK